MADFSLPNPPFFHYPIQSSPRKGKRGEEVGFKPGTKKPGRSIQKGKRLTMHVTRELH